MFFIQRSPFGEKIDSSEMSFSLLEQLAQITLGSAATSITFSGLDSGVDGTYLLVIQGKDTTGSSCYLELNGDPTATNYYEQQVTFNHNSLSGVRGNSNFIASLGPGGFSIYIWIGVTADDKGTWSGNITEYLSSTIRHKLNSGVTKNVLGAVLSSIVFKAGANHLDTGTRATLYKLGDV